MSIDRAKLGRILAKVPCTLNVEETALLLAAARAHLDTLPKTKMIEVWRVEYASNGVPNVLTFTSRDDADKWVSSANALPYTACIKLTGPHLHEVPFT